jgi:hypothetical protein
MSGLVSRWDFCCCPPVFKRCMDPNDDQKNPYQGTIVALMRNLKKKDDFNHKERYFF